VAEPDFLIDVRVIAIDPEAALVDRAMKEKGDRLNGRPLYVADCLANTHFAE
jgi:hypothetical protein